MRAGTASFFVAVLACAPALAACGLLGQDDVGDTEAGDEGGPDLRDVNWHEDVAPIVAEHCWSCHTDQGLAPFTLESYNAAAAWSGLMLEQVESGAMPPWGAVDSPDCTPRHGWKNDPRLSADELDVLAAWVEQGAPEGDPADAAPLPDPMPPALEGATHTLVPTVPHTVEGEADDFQCVVFDPEIDQWSWLTGLDVVPDEAEVVHHAVLLAVPPTSRDAVLEKAGDEGKYPCFGGELGAEGVYPVGLWVPGGGPTDLPHGLGVPLEAETLLVLQMHYHSVPGEARHDATEVDVRITETFPGKNLLFSVLGNAAASPILQPGEGDLANVTMFRIPADVSSHNETMIYDMPEDGERYPIFNIFPHMHYVGVNLQTKIERAASAPDEAGEECLINSDWNFDWQRTYAYDEDFEDLPTIGPGDRVTISCEYNNTMDNPFVLRALDELGLEAPVEVWLGEESLDEMCLAIFGVVI